MNSSTQRRSQKLAKGVAKCQIRPQKIEILHEIGAEFFFI